MSAAKWALAITGLLVVSYLVGASSFMLVRNYTHGGVDSHNLAVPTRVTTPAGSASTAAPAESTSIPAESTSTPPESTPTQPAPPTNSAESNLVSYWKLDGGESGLDDSGRARIRGIVTGTGSYAEGKIGRAFDFNGQNYITMPKSEALNSPSFSATLWVNPNKLRIQGVMDKVQSERWENGWRIFMDNYQGNIEFDASGEVANIITPPIEVEKWSFVAVTYDSTSRTARIYLNGLLSNTATGVDLQNTYPNNLVMASFEDLRLDGRLDDVRFYDTVLNDLQIMEIYVQAG